MINYKIIKQNKIFAKGTYNAVNFYFLGFAFQPRPTSTKAGQMFLGFDCAISTRSKKKITEVFRKSSFHRWTGSDITGIADEFNSKIQDWINYYGRFRKYSLMKIFRIFHHRLMSWAVNRYKRFKGSMRKAGRWIYKLARSHKIYSFTGNMVFKEHKLCIIRAV